MGAKKNKLIQAWKKCYKLILAFLDLLSSVLLPHIIETEIPTYVLEHFYLFCLTKHIFVSNFSQKFQICKETILYSIWAFKLSAWRILIWFIHVSVCIFRVFFILWSQKNPLMSFFYFFASFFVLNIKFHFASKRQWLQTENHDSQKFQ